MTTSFQPINVIYGQTDNVNLNNNLDLQHTYNVVNAPNQTTANTAGSTLISRAYADANYTGGSGGSTNHIQNADASS